MPSPTTTVPGAAAATAPAPASPPRNAVDRFFKITERGSTVSRELRGGLATFFTMAYIIVLNPIILSSGVDKYGNQLDNAQLVTATALTGGLTTLLMGLIGNVPVALATGLGVNTVVALQLAPQMTWPDAMGMVVLAGLLIILLVATGLRERVMNAIPAGLRKAISIGIGLFIAFIGLVDSGFLSRNPDAAGTTVPVGLGQGGHLTGWPVLIFALGALITLVLLTRKAKGAILISILSMTVLAIVVNAVADIDPAEWGLTVPSVPTQVVGAPDFGLIGEVSLFGGFEEVGLLTGCLFVFTLVLSCFFDAMGSILAVGEEAKLMDDKGRMPRMGRILMVDGLGVVFGGGASCSANGAFVESTAGVGEGARTGLANMVTGGAFLLALVFTPLALVVPSQAATPALVAVGFLLMTQVRGIEWDDFTIAIPAFLTIAMMPFTYSITNGIGLGFLVYVILKAATGQARRVPPLMWVVSAFFLVYFLLDPIQQALGV
ncbi:NCS2 family permease [Allostreptomyces psammosilenae]|uniref:AGZA family xanthine/uracil permease-like MFS transporter n=1 Tax=Allostreptomyces psammosilenae TaxID=1892865 RepID=A0A853A2L0_9ACTN|nr:NCS2 family permease [Allostreptomyces psammosilenae]NYI07700.1 AGZA family xanthine/uracil permease-like MFS transporter [Allostreptomyces psammosilenae]